MAKREAPRGSSETGDPLLLTPGPLTTSRSVKEAMVHDWGSRDADLPRHQQRGAGAPARDRERQGHSRNRADAGLGHVRRRGDAHDLRSPRRQGAAARQRRLRPARQAHLPDRRAQDRGARDGGGYAARPRGDRALAEGRPDHHARVRRAVRDDQRHPEPDCRDRRARGTIRAQAAGRCHERVRRPAAGRRQHEIRCPRCLLEQVHRGGSRTGLRHLPRGGAGRDQGQRHHIGARSARSMAGASPGPGNTASRRRSTSSSPSTRRWRSSGPRAGSPAAASATRRIAGS